MYFNDSITLIKLISIHKQPLKIALYISASSLNKILASKRYLFKKETRLYDDLQGINGGNIINVIVKSIHAGKFERSCFPAKENYKNGGRARPLDGNNGERGRTSREGITIGGGEQRGCVASSHHTDHHHKHHSRAER